MRKSLKGRILLLLTLVLMVQIISYANHFYILRSEFLEMWRKDANILVYAISDKLSSALEEKISKISTLIAKYEKMGLYPEEILWRLSGDVDGVTEGAFYDPSGRLVTYSSRLRTLSNFEDTLNSLLERTQMIGYYTDNYGELYVRVKIPDFQDNVFKGFYVISINVNTLLENMYPVNVQDVNLYLLDSKGKVLLSVRQKSEESPLKVRAKVKGTGWILVLEQPYTTVVNPAYRFLLRASLFGIVNTVGLGIVAFLVVLRIFKPLDRLKGNLLEWNEKRHINLKGDDEIGILSKTFEELIKRLEREKEVYMSIFNNFVDGMLLVDMEGNIKKVNRSFLERYSANEESLVGKNIEQFIEPYSYNALFIPEAFLTLGNKKYVVNVYAVRIKTEDGNFILYQLKDLTEKKELELMIYRTSKLSVAGEIACSIAHQLNNPLASILTYAEYIHNTSDNEKLKEKAQVIMKQALKSAQTVRKLLDIAKAFDGKPQEINPCDITREVVELLAFKARKKGVTLEFICDTNTEASVVCFPWKLEQILVNVIENAIDASLQDQKVEIRLKHEGDRFVWIVRDYGNGIPEDELHKVFEPFYTTKKDGIGLGLSLAKRFIEDMGGHIELKNMGNGMEVRIIVVSQVR
ncbi:MAG: ATP-binding protein [Hydrogenobacter sp.]